MKYPKKQPAVGNQAGSRIEIQYKNLSSPSLSQSSHNCYKPDRLSRLALAVARQELTDACEILGTGDYLLTSFIIGNIQEVSP